MSEDPPMKRSWLPEWLRADRIFRNEKRPSARGRRARVFCEALEDRATPTVTVSFASGVLTFTGDGAGDAVLLQSTATPSTVLYNAGGLGLTTQAGVTQVVYNAGGGTDELIVGHPGGDIFAPTGGITFNGGGDAGDQLTLVGGATN